MVVKVPKPTRLDPSRARVMSCWRPTGRRGSIGWVYDEESGSDQRIRTQILGGRYVGAVVDGSSEVVAWRFATVTDARTGRRRLDTEGCADRGDFAGIDEVVFLDHGGMAYACGALFLYRTPASARETLETAGASRLRVTRWSTGAVTLGWTAGLPAAEKELVLG